MINKIIGKSGNRLLQQIASSFGLRVTYMSCTFLTSLILARFLGRTEFGIYTYTVSWSYLLGVFGTVGLDNLLVREVAVYKGSLSWGLLRGILRWSNWLSVGFSMAIASVAVAIAWATGMANDPPLFTAFCLAMTALPFAALRNLRRGAMRGLERVSWGLIPEMLIAPVAILLTVLFAFAVARHSLTAWWCVVIYTVVTAATSIVSIKLLDRFIPNAVKIIAPQYNRRSWLVSALSFMSIEGIYVINAKVDILMLGSLQGVGDAGIYVPVNRGAQLINFVLMAISSALAPKIASLYAQGKLQQLQAIVVKNAKFVLVPTLFITAVLIGISSWYLGLFGSEFIAGQKALIILCLGQMLFTITGLGGLILNMTGHEKYTAFTGTTSAILNTILNYFLILRWGVVGAAIATSISLLIMNISNIILVRRKLQIKCTSIGL